MARSLVLNAGVYPVVTKIYNNADELLDGVKEEARKFMNFNKGDNIVITGSYPTVQDKHTNLMKIEEM